MQVLKPTGEFVTVTTGGLRGTVEQILFKTLQNHKVKKKQPVISSEVSMKMLFKTDTQNGFRQPY